MHSLRRPTCWRCTASALRWPRGAHSVARLKSSPAFRQLSSCSSISNPVHNAEDAELFDYTSGRWLYNESLRLQERRLPFNVPELTKVAANAVGKSSNDVKSLRKLAEGGFNRIFEFFMHDGTEVIARLPYPSTAPKKFAVASEVATMDLVRSQGVPIPRVHCYSAEESNTVGAEYIIMEKVSGKTLVNLWYDLPERERFKIVCEVVEMEARLFKIDLPASGSIYYDSDLPEGVARIPIPAESLPEVQGLCVGPETSLKLWFEERGEMELDRGPFTQPARVLQAVAEKEIAWIRNYGKARMPFDRIYREFTEYQKSQPREHLQNLERYLQAAANIVPTQEWLQEPTLRHPDLQPNNIFVSDDFKITGVIDWQHCAVLPLFLQAGIPKYFQNYEDEESENLVKPKLHDNLAELDDDDREVALEQFRRRQLHFFYLAATANMNKPHIRACNHEAGLFRRRIFTHAGAPWEGNSVPLKADLVRLAQHCSELVEPDSRTGQRPICPIAFDDEETKQCLSIAEKQEGADTLMETLRGAVGCSTDGWVPNARYPYSGAQAAQMKQMAIDFAESDYERARAQVDWPFDDYDEEE